MANPIELNGTHKRFETYENEIIPLMRNEFNIRAEFSRDYDGDPVGGAVNIPTRNGDVKLSQYDIKNGIELTQSETDYMKVLIDTEVACNELIDGYEATAVPDNLKAQRIESASYVFGKQLEDSAIKALVDGGTKETSTDALTKENVYEYIAGMVKTLKARGIKADQIRLAISADTELLLITDERYSNSAGSLGEKLLREGFTGKINGVAVKPNYVMPENLEVVAYAKPWCQSIDAFKINPTINNLADAKHIGASALQGRMVYKDVVTNPLAVQYKTKGEITL